MLIAGAVSALATRRAAAELDTAESAAAMETALIAPDFPPASRAVAAPVAGSARAGRWLSIGVGSGPVQWDEHLADYQWDVRPRLGWSAQAFAGVRRFALGVRLWNAGSEQSLGSGGAGASAAVNARSLELAARTGLASFHGVELLAAGSVGRLHVAWSPDHVELPAAGGPIGVDLAPIDAWVLGLGMGVQRSLGGPWTGRLELDRRAFGWDTAHRAGDSIEVGRESFRNWSARLEVDWVRHGR